MHRIGVFPAPPALKSSSVRPLGRLQASIMGEGITEPFLLFIVFSPVLPGACHGRLVRGTLLG